jgi:KipI family sensor histidine kinase inhibitor
MNNLTVVVDPDAVALEAFCSVLKDRWSSVRAGMRTSQRVIEIPVAYGGVDGPDLEVVARHCGLTNTEIVARHSAADYVVYFLGFQPGFAYLGGMDPSLATPRRAEPRTIVPAGSVGIGGMQTGVYPAATPGGWQIIGRTAITLFNPEAQPPALLQAGDRVRFVPVSSSIHA